MNIMVLNSFDRSGSSAISRTLSSHPNVELIMQPFNSGPVRKRMYQEMNVENLPDSVLSFFEKLESDMLDNDFIQSHWHQQYSTTKTIIPGKLHVIKTTINHFLQDFMNRKVKGVEVWGIWRDPVAIVNSALRNGFVASWYYDAFEHLWETIAENPMLNSSYGGYKGQLKGDLHSVAFILAVLNHYFFFHLPKNRVLLYEEFTKNVNGCFAPVVEHYHLSAFDFDPISKEDLNLIGKKRDLSDKLQFDPIELEFMNELFAPLRSMMQTKHGIV